MVREGIRVDRNARTEGDQEVVLTLGPPFDSDSDLHCFGDGHKLPLFAPVGVKPAMREEPSRSTRHLSHSQESATSSSRGGDEKQNRGSAENQACCLQIQSGPPLFGRFPTLSHAKHERRPPRTKGPSLAGRNVGCPSISAPEGVRLGVHFQSTQRG